MKRPNLVEQPHGGALLTGGVPGNRGGTGRPPSAIRLMLRGSLEGRIKILEAIIDAEDARDSDRIRALDLLAKYGLGTAFEVSGPDAGPFEVDVESVRERLVQRIARIAGKAAGTKQD